MDTVEFVQTVVKDLQGIASVPALQVWAARLNEAALLGRPRVALKKFVEANPRLDTLQLRVLPEGKVTKAWSPGMREVVVRPTFVTFTRANGHDSGSRREYSGIYNICSSDTTWVGVDPDAETIIAYSNIALIQTLSPDDEPTDENGEATGEVEDK